MSMSWSAAARLARRTGFGATGTEVDAVQKAGAEAYAAGLVARRPSVTAPSFDTVAPVGRNASSDARKKHNQALGAQLTDATAWWVRLMAGSPVAFDEKLTFLWHNHFATSAQKVRSAPAMVAQNQKLRTMGRGSFSTLAYAMLTDAALLRWLDGEKNTAKAPNENLAREFMELMTLGHDNGYTETDVRAAARCLTGWTVSASGAARFVPARHDSGSKTLLGVTGDLDAQGFCNAVLARPQSPGYVVGRTWSQLSGSGAIPTTALDAYGSGRDLGAMLHAMLVSPEFTAASGQLVVDPVEWTIGAVRALRVPLSSDTSVRQVVQTLRALGQLPFYPPNVSGWPAGQAWLSTAAADQRVATANRLVAAGDVSPVADAAASARLDATAHLLGVPAWSDRSAAVLKPLAGTPDRLVATALNTPEYLTN